MYAATLLCCVMYLCSIAAKGTLIAQFEREVTFERIRDKIAASKKKGLWMGGVRPLGMIHIPIRRSEIGGQ